MVIKADDIQDVSSVRPPKPTLVCAVGRGKKVHLNNVLKKCGIYDMFDDDQIRFLGNVGEQFKMYTGNSVNYVSFLHNYFEKVSSEDWHVKIKFSNFYLFTSLNNQKPSNVQMMRLMNGGEPSDLLPGSKQFAVFDI